MTSPIPDALPMASRPETASERLERIYAEFKKDTGFMGRGKSLPPELWYDGYDEARDAAWDTWRLANQELFNALRFPMARDTEETESLQAAIDRLGIAIYAGRPARGELRPYIAFSYVADYEDAPNKEQAFMDDIATLLTAYAAQAAVYKDAIILRDMLLLGKSECHPDVQAALGHLDRSIRAALSGTKITANG